VAGSAAAALVLLGGAGYGVSAALAGHAPAGTGTRTAAFTAVSGCAALEQVNGTLEQVNGTSLVIATAGGQPVTVTTTSSTMMSVAGAALSDITDGMVVSVTGPSSDGTIAAGKISVGLPPPSRKPLPPGSSQQTTNLPPGYVNVQGTVSNVSTAGFTVVTSDGTRVPVTTSSGTLVNIRQASLGQLLTGASTTAVGYAGPDGTLSAVAVLQSPPGASARLQVSGCSPAAVDNAITTALVSRG
jgi:hypothetical protein